MDFLNKAIAQITDLFRSMTPGSADHGRAAAGRVGRELGISVQPSVVEPRRLFDGWRSDSLRQLPAIYEAFAKAKLSGYEIDANHRIRVPEAQKQLNTWRRWPIRMRCRAASATI